MTEPKKLLIVGLPRSGTKWSSKVWQKMGLDIGHEYVAGDGSSTRFFGVDVDRYPSYPTESPKGRLAHVGERRSDYTFEQVWHQVRHPLTCITSNSLALPRGAFRWYAQHISLDATHPDIRYVAMQFWLLWNAQCQEYVQSASDSPLTYRIENIDNEWDGMCDRLGIDHAPLPDIKRDLNRSKRWSRPFVDRKAIQAQPDLTWDDLNDIDCILADRVRALATSYGYE